MTEHKQEKTGRHPTDRAHLGFPALVLAASLILALFAAFYSWRAVRLQNQNSFEREARELHSAIGGRMQAYRALLQGGAAFVSAEEAITKRQFSTYVERLRIATYYPGLQGFGYTVLIAPEQKKNLVSRMRQEGKDDFKLWPETERQEYHAIIYLLPEDKRNQAALGYDMHTEPTRRLAMDRARDTGEAAVSGRVTLVQEIEGPVQAGFLMYVPVYAGGAVPVEVEDRRRLLRGFVYSPFRADDLFEAVAQGEYVGMPLEIEVYDGSEEHPEQLLHRSTGEKAKVATQNPAFSLVIPLEIAGSRWTIRYSTPRGFPPPTLVVALTLIVGIVLSGIMYYLAYTQNRARLAAERAAASLRISEQSLMEARKKLEEHAIGLEQRVRERTAELEQSLADLEKVLYHVAHDLRAPARAMGSFALLVTEEYGPKLDYKAKDYLARIAQGARRMDRLVSDLLTYGRTAHVKLQLQPVRLQEIIDLTLNAMANKIQSTGADVRIDGPLPAVQANGPVLMDVMYQLLSNALKYVKDGEKPKVRLWAERRDSMERIWVEDHGIGFRPEYRDRIFRVFERLHAMHEFSGTGIGLAIAAKAIGRMGGRIGAESEDGKGSRFWVELPGA